MKDSGRRMEAFNPAHWGKGDYPNVSLTHRVKSRDAFGTLPAYPRNAGGENELVDPEYVTDMRTFMCLLPTSVTTLAAAVDVQFL